MFLSLASIAADETRCGGVHHVSQIVGYVAVETEFGVGKVRDAQLFEGDTSYGAAIECVQQLRADAGEGGYARCDVLYDDGCRGIL